MTNTRPQFGIIIKNFSYALDGEYSSGRYEYNVKVSQWWGKGGYYNEAKEVITEDNVYYRHSKKYGWRKYDKIRKRFEENYIGNYVFTPNKIANTDNNWSRLNLGGW
jgi:hypothetical protein